MQRRTFLTLLCLQTGATITLCSSSGCGMMFHPERRGRPHSGKIDWQIAALNGLCLFLFVVPGVIAFAVDFYTGAIYLPHSELHYRYGSKQLRCVPLPPDSQSIEEIERIVASQTGQQIDLQGENARVSELAKLEDFETQRRKHEENASFGHKLKSFFAKPA